MTDAREGAYLQALEEVAARAAAAGRLDPPGFEAVLRTVVEATVALFDAEAASIALYDPATDRLVFRVAAGRAGRGRRGDRVPPTRASSATCSRPASRSRSPTSPRTRASAARRPSGPATSRARSSPCRSSTTRRDRRPRGARQARRRGFGAPRPRASRRCSPARRRSRSAPRGVERDGAELLRGALARLAAGCRRRPGSPRGALVGAVARELDGEDDDRLWALADAVARVRQASPEQLGLVVEILDGPRPARGATARTGAVVPPVTERLPAWSEPFATGRRDAPGPPRPVGPRGPRRGRSATGRAPACASRSSTPAWRAPTRRSGAGSCESVARRARGEDWEVVTIRAARRRRARDGVRGDHPRPRAGRRASCRSASSGRTTGARAGRSRPASHWAIEHAGASVVNLSPLVPQRGAVRAPPRARGRGVLRERAAGLGGEQRRRRRATRRCSRRSCRSRRTTSRDRGRVVLQPGAARGVRGVRAQRRRRVAGRLTDRRDRQQLRGARTSPGYAALIRAAHPGVTPFEVKAILAATADSAVDGDAG